MDKPNIHYDAFISYRHLEPDKTIATKLQIMLESYKPPRDAQCINTRKIERIFRDETELPTSSSLNQSIIDALDASDFLIVICSPELQKSKWCMEEIKHFKEIHGGSADNILLLLADGTPEESIPDSLKYDTITITAEDGSATTKQIEIEPLAANLSAGGDLKQKKKLLKREFLRIAAPVLGCSFDNLYQRHKRRHKRKVITTVALAASLILAASGYVAFRNYNEKKIVNRMEHEQMLNSLNFAEKLIADGDKLLANTVVMDAVKNPDKQDAEVAGRYEQLLSMGTYVPKYGQYGILRTENDTADIAFSDDEKTGVLANGNVASVYNLQNGAFLHELECQDEISSLCISKDELFVVEKSGTVTKWNLKNYSKKKEFAIDFEFENTIVYDMVECKGKLIALYKNPNSEVVQVTVFDASNGETLLVADYQDKTYNYHTSETPVFFDEGVLLLSDNNNWYSYDIETGTKETLCANSEDIIKCLPANDGNGNRQLILIDSNVSFTLYDVASGESRQIALGDGTALGTLTAAKVSPDGRFLAVSYYKDGCFIVVDLWDKSAPPYVTSVFDYQYIDSIDFVNETELMVGLGSGGKACYIYKYSDEYKMVFMTEAEIGGLDNICKKVGSTCFAVACSGGETMLFSTAGNSGEKEYDYPLLSDLDFTYAYFNTEEDRGLVCEDNQIKCVRLSDEEEIYSYTDESNIFIYGISSDLEYVLYPGKDAWKLTDLKNQSKVQVPSEIADKYEAFHIMDSDRILALADGQLFEIRISDKSETPLSKLELDASGAINWHIKPDEKNDRVIVSHSYAGNPMDNSTYVFKLSTGHKLMSEDGFYLSGKAFNASSVSTDKIYAQYNVYDREFTVPTLKDITDKAHHMVGERTLTEHEREMISNKQS